jgi:protein-L-isoaspartate(D-aspartate) O-methyltransferase
MSAAQHRARRQVMIEQIEVALGPFPPAHLRAMRDVPRESFVRDEDEAKAELDVPLALDDSHAATISAPHAYLLSYRLLGLTEGDRMLELGSGTGYGAALAAAIVGPTGSVVTIEIDPTLAGRAEVLLAEQPNVTTLAGDALQAAEYVRASNKIACAFAVEELPPAWTGSLEPGSILVAPVGPVLNQELVRVSRNGDGSFTTTRHGAVRYVANRSA